MGMCVCVKLCRFARKRCWTDDIKAWIRLPSWDVINAIVMGRGEVYVIMCRILCKTEKTKYNDFNTWLIVMDIDLDIIMSVELLWNISFLVTLLNCPTEGRKTV